MRANKSPLFTGAPRTGARKTNPAVLSGIAAALLCALVFPGCPQPTDSVSPAPALRVVTALDLTSHVTAPVKYAVPSTRPFNLAQYTGTVAWKRLDNSPVTETFAPGTQYRAVVNLASKQGYTFTGVRADSFTYSGAVSVTNAEGGWIVTITFPATASDASPTPVNDLGLDTLVPAPVYLGTPTPGIGASYGNPTANDQYWGPIAWTETSGGAPLTGSFDALTGYTATLTLTVEGRVRFYRAAGAFHP